VSIASARLRDLLVNEATSTGLGRVPVENVGESEALKDNGDEPGEPICFPTLLLEAGFNLSRNADANPPGGGFPFRRDDVTEESEDPSPNITPSELGEAGSRRDSAGSKRRAVSIAAG
jgi:hypothetical protein